MSLRVPSAAFSPISFMLLAAFCVISLARPIIWLRLAEEPIPLNIPVPNLFMPPTAPKPPPRPPGPRVVRYYFYHPIAFVPFAQVVKSRSFDLLKSSNHLRVFARTSGLVEVYACSTHGQILVKRDEKDENECGL